jgi:hypothetical protein
LKTEAQPSKKNGAPAKVTPAKAAPVKRGPKAKAAAAPAKKATKAKSASSNAIEGRAEVNSGVRPPVKDAVRLILGTTTMRSRDITTELVARGWKPRSGNLASYVPYVLSNGSKTHDKEGRKLNPVFESVNTGEGRGFYRVRTNAPPMNPKTLASFGGKAPKKTTAQAAPKKTAAPKVAAPAPKKAATVATKGGPRKCSVKGCGVLGHNKRGHAKYVKEQQAAAKAAANGKPHTNGKTTHATKKVAKAVAAATKKVAKAAAPAPKKTATKAKAAPAKDRRGVGQQKCGEPGCGVLGHNKKGHAAWLAKQAGGTAPKAATPPKAAKPATPKAAPKKTETKAAAAPEPTAPAPSPASTPAVVSTEPTLKVRTSDQIIAEEDAKAAANGGDNNDKTVQEGMAAFGVEA